MIINALFWNCCQLLTCSTTRLVVEQVLQFAALRSDGLQPQTAFFKEVV